MHRECGATNKIALERNIGLKIAHDAYEVSPFYWDRTPETRAWAERFFAKAKIMPTGFHAGVYSSVSHYLKAVKATGTKRRS